MSNWCDRKRAGRAWHPSRTVEMLALIEQFREYERILSGYPDPGGDVARLKAEFWASTSRALDCVPVKPGQQCGTRLGKRSNQAMRIYGRISDIEKQQWGTKVRCALNCDGMDVFKLRKAVERMHNRQLGQMTNPDLRSAGLVLRAEVAGDGLIDLVAVVTDPVAMTKVSERTYTGILCSFDGDEIASINVIDSPVAFMDMAKGPVRFEVIAKLYQKEGETMKTQREIEKAAINYALQHKMTGAQPEVDIAVWRLLYKASGPVGQISTRPVTSSLGLMTGRAR
jgi:hypothetical protein